MYVLNVLLTFLHWKTLGSPTVTSMHLKALITKCFSQPLLLMLPLIPAYSLPQIMVTSLRDHPGNAVPKCIGAIASLKTVHQISGGSSNVTYQQFFTTGFKKIFYRPLNADAKKSSKTWPMFTFSCTMNWT